MAVEPVLLDVPEVIRGPRVVVRPYRPGDAGPLLAGVDAARPDLERRLRSKRGFDGLDDARRLVARSMAWWILREAFVAGIFGGEDGVFRGGVSLHPISWPHGRFEVGYWLCPAARGQGLATEAVRLVSRLAFAHLGAQRVEIFVEGDNPASARVAERAGFVHEGLLRRYLPVPDGTVRDAHVYALVREDFDGVGGDRS